MLNYLREKIEKDDTLFKADRTLFKMPHYDPRRHYLDLANSPYFRALLTLRHYIRATLDYYFSNELGAKNIDLFMFTPSISSPIGPGSDSAPIKIKFGKFKSNLVDSSQFGFEPLLLNGFDKVYSYLPSMRGENPDTRHLNQFFHCEMEMIGTLDQLVPLIERCVKTLCETILLMENIVSKISIQPKATKRTLDNILKAKKFPKITFDEAVEILVKNKKEEYVNFTKHGRDICMKGELELLKILKTKTPLWVTNYDRDRVPFYQNPDPNDQTKCINADLLFSPIIDDAFGGEIVGAGQRQNNIKEMYESLKRQNISTKSYGWYIKLRKHPNYKVTSGFGLGIERFITWALGRKNIRDAIIYPRIKNVETYP